MAVIGLVAVGLLGCGFMLYALFQWMRRVPLRCVQGWGFDSVLRRAINILFFFVRGSLPNRPQPIQSTPLNFYPRRHM